MGVPDLWAAITRFGNKTLLFTKLYRTAGPFALILITINYLRHNAVNVKGIICNVLKMFYSKVPMLWGALHII